MLIWVILPPNFEGTVPLLSDFLLLRSLILYILNWRVWVVFFFAVPIDVLKISFFLNHLEVSWWCSLVWVFFHLLCWTLDKLFQSRKSCSFLSNISLIISFSCFLWSYFWSFPLQNKIMNKRKIGATGSIF